MSSLAKDPIFCSFNILTYSRLRDEFPGPKKKTYFSRSASKKKRLESGTRSPRDCTLTHRKRSLNLPSIAVRDG
jgi:hypothetical protein